MGAPMMGGLTGGSMGAPMGAPVDALTMGGSMMGTPMGGSMGGSMGAPMAAPMAAPKADEEEIVEALANAAGQESPTADYDQDNSLHAGDTIMWWCQVFGAGDARGYRRGVIEAIQDEKLSIVGGAEVSSYLRTVKRLERFGAPLKGKSQPLAHYDLVSSNIRVTTGGATQVDRIRAHLDAYDENIVEMVDSFDDGTVDEAGAAAIKAAAFKKNLAAV